MSETIQVAPAQAPYSIGNLDRGQTLGTVSSQWSRRPDDQRFLSMEDLLAHTKALADRSWAEGVALKNIQVVSSRNNMDQLALLDEQGRELNPTHWAFGQLCTMIGAPAAHYRRLPGPIASIPLQYLLRTERTELGKFYGTNLSDGGHQLRAITSPTYGRVMDYEVVEAMMSVLDDTWKVPGMIDWGRMKYDPNHPISKDTTTLYGSDRDVFVFLVRDQYPVEVGKLPNGDPDYMFPGIMVYNSEVGSRSLGIEFMWLRGICCNRNLWGVEDRQVMRIIHTSKAKLRFDTEGVRRLIDLTQQPSSMLQAQVAAARSIRLVDDYGSNRTEPLTDLDFSKKAATEILDRFLIEEGRVAENAWDYVNAVTAWARDIPHQDDRIAVERVGARFMKPAINMAGF